MNEVKEIMNKNFFPVWNQNILEIDYQFVERFSKPHSLILNILSLKWLLLATELLRANFSSAFLPTMNL